MPMKTTPCPTPLSSACVDGYCTHRPPTVILSPVLMALRAIALGVPVGELLE